MDTTDERGPGPPPPQTTPSHRHSKDPGLARSAAACNPADQAHDHPPQPSSTTGAMSYGNGGGGTLTLPSPSGVHHVDVSAAVRSLRRSLSRSPSKLNIARTYSHHSDSTPSTPGSPSPCRIIQRPMPPASAPQLSHQHSQANFATPFRSAVKLSLRSGKPKAASAKPLSRTRVSPRSPVKRALSNTTDSGNCVIASSSSLSPAANTLFDQENNTIDDSMLKLGVTPRKPSEKHYTRHSMHLDMLSGSANTFPRVFDLEADPITSSFMSPLKKRSDIFKHPAQANSDSPVAKRRSLLGISGAPMSEPDDVFDATSPIPRKFDIHEDPSKEYNFGPDSPFYQHEPASPTPVAMPRRSDSLRRSTLQQRQGDKSSWGRRQGEKHLAQMGAEVPSPMPRNTGRPRVSLDQFVQPALPRDSPFSAQAPLPNPSLHLLDRPHLQAHPHPLSRSVTTSSSNSSVADESPTHIPVLFDRPRAHPFAKSMPVGARPLYESNRGAATPAYKNAKPCQDAFKSTGLISKVNRNPELEQATFRESKMPDTPCKKPIYPSNTYPPSSGGGVAGGGGGKGRQRQSYGSPSSPQAPDRKNSFSFGDPENVSSLFKSFQPSQSKDGRQMSVVSDVDTQSLDDNDEFPPTPTRSVFFKNVGNSKTIGSSPFVKTTAPATISSLNFRDVHQTPDPTCKSVSFSNSSDSDYPRKTCFEINQNRDALGAILSSPMSEPLSFGRARTSRGPQAATPETLTLHPAAPILSSQKTVQFAKPETLITASPFGSLDKKLVATTTSPLECFDKLVATNSPKTPCDNTDFVPPDPGSLSISNHPTSGVVKMGGSLPPATPTTRLEQFGGFADRRMSLTPVNGGEPSDVDMVLNSRFEQVEPLGKGEFSQVFKVTQVPDATITQSRTPGTPPTPSEARVFAVKKIRLQFFSAKDREAKLREVHMLERLRGRPHVLQYVDHWEKHFHLYIQTEYCEEGSLSGFLGNVGSAGRLDDFRIWKILIEASMGLQSIHEAGIIHLDFKPANILVNYEGQLKIGDFGLATQWPAARGIEGEGDRRYIAPEILSGIYDKPADIFSLGLIMFEIASNVWLPDNGPHWLALRQGNFSAVPTGPLTGRESDALQRDATGMPISDDLDPNTGASLAYNEIGIRSNIDKSQDFPFNFMPSPTHDASNLFGSLKRGDLRHPPKFMIQAEHALSLDRIVQWMLSPNPVDRPTIQQLLDFESVQWVTTHRRAGATVFEGNWGPQDDGEIDTEMADV